MSKAKTNPPPNRSKGVAGGPAGVSTPPPTPAKVAPLYRPVDWLTFGVTTLLVFIGYCLTIAPDLTLEDCGELATGSFYAGVPHPPGYPVWTIYTWLFTVLLPFYNIAWRVAVSSAVASALSCGLIGLMVSRGSSMILEGIPELKDIDRRWENAICVVSGYVAGMLMGFNGFMWSQAIIVEVYTLSVLSLVGVLCCLLHWIYDTSKERYLYWALFLFGICFTNHQTLIVAAVGIEVLILARSPKLGRDLFLANSALYLLGLMAKASGTVDLFNNSAIFKMYNVIGIGSLITGGWMVLKTNKLFTEWKTILIMGLLWVVGCLFYFYMPLASMSNPPMNWGYPRTVDGFKHALTRGQYESAKPTSDPLLFFKQIILYSEGAIEEFNFVYLVIGLVPFVFLFRMQNRERAWIIGLSAIYLCLAVLLLILLNPQPDRQSLSLNRVFFTSSHVMIAMAIGYGLTLIAGLVVMNYERFRPYAITGAAAATGVALYAMVNLDQLQLLPIKQTTSIFALLLAFATLAIFVVFRGKTGPIIPLLGLFVLFPAHSIMSHWWENEQRGHLFGFWFGHDMFTPPFKGKDGQPIYPKMAKDAVLFGGTDPGRFNPTYMIFCESFIPPAKKQDPEFDRRDVYIITQNALADGTYLSYIRAHYNRSTQIDPPFFQELLRRPKERKENTMTNLLAQAVGPLDHLFTSLGDRIEKDRRVGPSFFKAEDFTDVPGLAGKLAKGGEPAALSKYLADNLSESTRQLLSAPGKEKALAKALARDFNATLEKGLFDCRSLKQKTEEKRILTASLEGVRKQKTLAGQDLQKLALAEKELQQQLDPVEKSLQAILANISGIKFSDYVRRFLQENPQSHPRIRLGRLILEEAYPKQLAKSVGGVYPDMEIHTPTPEDSQKSFEEYVTDAQKRIKLNQLKPGEDVRIDGDKLQVSGQVAVMAINGLLTKVIFDKNPDHEFYVEESFPLDWMFPYLTPYGIIMKINRQQLPELTDAIIAKDHEFWSQFSGRLIGNWITYDTPVKEIAKFAERIYLRGDFTGFKGDPKFVRDDNAQKAFSKLRSAIAGLYTWRINNSKSVAEQQRMIREAEFAYRQAFAFCPYSPEAVFRYANLLASLQRFDDALSILLVCRQLDPGNALVQSYVDQLQSQVNSRKGPPPGQPQSQVPTQPQPPGQPQQMLPQLEQQYRTNSTDLATVIKLASAYWQVQRTNEALAVLDKLTSHSKIEPGTLTTLAQAYAQLGQVGRLEFALQRLVAVTPQSPEAWYDLASVQAAIGKNADAIKAISNAFRLSDERFARNKAERNLRTNALNDPKFTNLRNLPDYQKLTAPK